MFISNINAHCFTFGEKGNFIKHHEVSKYENGCRWNWEHSSNNAKHNILCFQGIRSLGSPSCRNNFPRGLLLFSKAFSKCSLTKASNTCPVNGSSYCSHSAAPWPWTMATRTFIILLPEPIFPLVVHFNVKPSDFLRHVTAVVDLAWSNGLVL